MDDLRTSLEIPFDRITYREGQRLTALDLREDGGRDARLRRLHVHHLHDTWGIALGFEVRLSDATAVAVGPGYALDGEARELLLATAVHLPVPAGGDEPQPFVLVMRFQEDAEYAGRGELAGLCLNEAMDPRGERPEFRWVRQEEVEFGPMVPLAQAVVQGGVVQGELDPRVRRYARRHVRPHVVVDATQPGATGWQNGPFPLIQVEVRTERAGFTQPPLYFATLRRDPTFGTDDSLPGVSAVPGRDTATFLGPWSYVAEARADGFRFCLIMPDQGFKLLDSLEQRGWYVEWIGVQPASSLEPGWSIRRLFSLIGLLFPPPVA